jgi:tetratricopeptide (TPR) repeat protein
MSSTKLSAFCDKVLEIGWCLALIITPLFFNVYSSRVFEPDKLTAMRTVATIMAAVWLVKRIEEHISGRRGFELTWRTPLVLPTLFTVVIYLLCTLLSVTSWVSFYGSYQRLQGTYTTLSYIVIFFVVLQELRTRAQLDRLITVVVVNSLAIALYGFLQHNRLDPLPWGGDVSGRIASNMGNAIFVAAYLIMAALPTLARVVDAFRSILADEEASTADVLRAAVYIFALLVQIIAIWYSGSRGPLMGLLAGLGVWAFLGLLSLQRAVRQEQPFQSRDLLKDLGLGLAFGLGSLAAAGGAAAGFYFSGKAIFAQGSSAPQWIAMGAALLVLLGIWMVFIVSRRGWRWLWISAMMISILAIAGFLVINLVEPVHAWSQEQPWLGRLDEVLHAGGGSTGIVRNLIWQGALDLISPHKPLDYPPTPAYPEGRPDPFNALRPLVGYGPESMYVAYNRFYPPLLGHYESRTASPDRSHNETMDSLVITGLLGFAAYLWLFGSIFYFSLHWLGFLPEGWRRILFFALLTLGAVAAVVVVTVTSSLGLHFFCLAIPIGMVGGLFLYLAVYGFSVYWEPELAPKAHPYLIMLTGILCAMVAHFVEINFGIAIASTRTTFWAYAGALVVAGIGLVGEREVEPRLEQKSTENNRQGGRKRRKRRKAVVQRSDRFSLPSWLGPMLAVAVVGGFVLGTLAFDFITNAERLINPLTVVWHALTALPMEGGRTSYGVLMVFALTWLMSAVLFISQMVKGGVFRERKDDWILATVLYLLVSLAVGFAFALVLAGGHTSLVRTPPQSLEELANRVAGHLTSYYSFIAFALVAGGVAFLLGMRRLPQQTAHPWGAIALIVLVILAGAIASAINLTPIQADIVYKQADPYDREGQWPAAIELYEYAIRLAPKEDFYYLYLGRARLEQAKTIEDPAVRDNVMRVTEDVLTKAREINPLNTDHSANLARMYRTWAEMTSDAEARQALIQRSSDSYAIATSLSRNHAILWNEWALLYFYVGDFERAQETITHSLEIDPDYEQTWTIQADLYASQNQIADAIEAYKQSLEALPRQTEVWLRLGDMYMGQNQLEKAAEAYEQALELSPNQTRVWRVLGSVYAQLGRLDDAIVALQRALEIAPEASDAWDTHRMLAVIYSQLGQNDMALFHAEMALESAPEDQQPMLQDLVAQLQVLSGGTQP